MRELSFKTKQQVVVLFFSGLSYDQISQSMGISKGAVVNIIDDYREGRLVLTGNMTECVDELRRVAVDLDLRLDARRFLQGCPRRLVQIAYKRYSGIPLNRKEQYYLNDYRRRYLQKTLI